MIKLTCTLVSEVFVVTCCRRFAAQFCLGKKKKTSGTRVAKINFKRDKDEDAEDKGM